MPRHRIVRFSSLAVTGLAAVLLVIVLGAGCSERAPEATRVDRQALGAVNWLTRSYDNARTAANTSESVLTQANVKFGTFGKLFDLPVDDQVYAQPLYASSVPDRILITLPPPAGSFYVPITRNEVFVATVNNSVYAFDADSGTLLWQQSRDLFGIPPSNHQVAQGLNGPGRPLVGEACGGGGKYNNFSGNDGVSGSLSYIGIVGTPVIDGSNNTMFVVTRSLTCSPLCSPSSSNEVQYTIWKINIANDSGTAGQVLSERIIDPSVVTYPGTGDNNDGSGHTTHFSPDFNNQRPGLALANGTVYVAFASYCDARPFHGWVVAYDTSLNFTGAVNATPNGSEGGVWQGGNAPAIDGSGNVYFATGNGDWDGQSNFGNSVIKRTPRTLNFLDWFAPKNAQVLSNSDLDIASTGPSLLPPGFPAQLIQGSKSGTFYLVSQQNMGGTTILQTFPSVVGPACTTESGGAGSHHIHNGVVLWSGPQGLNMYVWGENDYLEAYRYNTGLNLFNTTPVAAGSFLPPCGMPGGMMSLSSNGSQSGSGILWATTPWSGDASGRTVPGVFYAFNAESLGNPIFAAKFGNFAKYNPPMVANGKVYVPTFSNKVSVFGLRAKGVVGDVDGDGLGDITLSGGIGWSSIPVAFSNGDGSFRVTNSMVDSFASFAQQAGAVPVAGDFDGDRKSDVALTGGPGLTSIPVAFSNGDGTFRVTNSVVDSFGSFAQQAGARPVAGDFDGDGKTDIALAGGTVWTSIPVAYSNGDGTFRVTNTAVATFPALAAHQGALLVAGDFDGDGRTDVALTGGSGWSSVPVAFSNGADGSFMVTNSTVASFPAFAQQQAAQVVTTDIDGDGRADLALTGVSGWTSVPVAFSKGDGTFRVTNTVVSNFPTFAAQSGAKAVSATEARP